jgi:hypothetical protein
MLAEALTERVPATTATRTPKYPTGTVKVVVSLAANARRRRNGMQIVRIWNRAYNDRVKRLAAGPI